MRQRLLSVLLVGLVVLSGCSAVQDAIGSGDGPSATATPEGEDTSAALETSVRFPNGGVSGEQSVVTVDVENTGETERSYNATLTADGETVAEETVTLAAGESTTVSLSHTFETTGDHDLAVGDAETTMRVYDSAFAFTDAEMERVETARIEESGTVEATIPVNGTTLEATADASATVLKNFSAETLYRNETTRTTVLGRTSVERTEEWVVDGTLFARTVAEGGERNYTREPSDEFEDSDELENETILDYLSTDHTDEEYVLVVEPETSAEATELVASLGEGDSEALPVDSVDEIYFEVRYDRQTGRTTEQVVRFSGEGGESVDSFEFTLRQEYVAFNETVSVEVPDEVRDRATRSGTTVGAGTRASLPAAEAA